MCIQKIIKFTKYALPMSGTKNFKPENKTSIQVPLYYDVILDKDKLIYNFLIDQLKK